jgi:hypothetical protein
VTRYIRGVLKFCNDIGCGVRVHHAKVVGARSANSVPGSHRFLRCFCQRHNHLQAHIPCIRCRVRSPRHWLLTRTHAHTHYINPGFFILSRHWFSNPNNPPPPPPSPVPSFRCRVRLPWCWRETGCVGVLRKDGSHQPRMFLSRAQLQVTCPDVAFKVTTSSDVSVSQSVSQLARRCASESRLIAGFLAY